jgi:monoamine oxidase
VPDVVVVGAGLAGLACALHLTRAGLEVSVLEASDGVGGRVRTDVVDGMLLDRGFQVLNTGYPELRRTVDLDALDLQPFVKGALVRHGGRLHRVADPRSAPSWLLPTLTSPVATAKDRAALVALTARDAVVPVRRLLDAAERSTQEHLHAHGLSDIAVERLMRPFLTGVFLDPKLETSSHFFDVVWRSFARGRLTVPSAGMGALPAQLAAALPAGTVQLDTPVTKLPAGRVVVATDGRAAAELLDLPMPAFRSVTTHYHLADRPPLPEAAIVLDGEQSGPVTNTVVLTNAAPSYAPGRVLVSSSVVGTSASEAEVRAHLARLYGVSTSGWEHVRSYDIPEALPSMAPPLGRLRRPVRVRDSVFVCGDHRDTASLQGALVSGRRAAAAVLNG